MNIKTEAARMYEQALNQDLTPYYEKAKMFCDGFNPKRNHLFAHWEIYSPDLMTKDGAVSRNSTDLDSHKVLQDTIMRFIGIDDAYIVRDTRHKFGGEYSLRLTLRIMENNGEDLL